MLKPGPADHIFLEPNLGYDWSGSQQFIARGWWWKSYDVIFFMHDDLFIRNLDFIPHSLELILSGAQVVGNGLNSPQVAWPRTICFAAHAGAGSEHFYTIAGRILEQLDGDKRGPGFYSMNE